MKKSILNRGSITIEINSLNPEKILNILWKRDIDIIEAKKTSITTIFLTISYENYKEIYKIVAITICDTTDKFILWRCFPYTICPCITV